MFRISIPELEEKAYKIRRQLIDLIYQAGSGHLDTCLSLVEVWLAIVYSAFFKFDPKRGAWESRTPLFLSEGHACPLQYLVNADLGYYPVEEVFAGFRKPHTLFQGHTVRHLPYGLENSNGSLGIGLWQAYGYVLVSQELVFCIVGDGEMQEPSSLGFLTAPFFIKPAPNFVLIINNNGLAQDAAIGLGPLPQVAELYRWQMIETDGHDFKALGRALQSAIEEPHPPSLIVCQTIKGKGGNPAWEGQLGHHGVPPKNEAEYQACLQGLENSKGQS